MPTESESLQNGHVQRFKVASRFSPSHKRGPEPHRDVPRQCDRSPFLSSESDQYEHLEREHIRLRIHPDIHAFQRICMISHTDADSRHIYKKV